ncbi:MAG TPA: hypothetical protein VGM67_12040 [Gemmatimonadaceae bacterium]|jgi:hypothetical protein
MDLYISSLLLGAVGLGVMAVSGLGHHGHAGRASARGPMRIGHAGHGHAGHAGHANANAANTVSGARNSASNVLWAVASPRYLFSFFLGFGAVGELLRPMLGGVLLGVAAVAGAVLFERLVVSPLWNLSMRFASTPASMLESAVADEATAVTAFDANGQGIVSIEVDGQIVQILATLRRDDRLLGGARIRAGQRVRIEDVDAAKNCCTISLI